MFLSRQGKQREAVWGEKDLRPRKQSEESINLSIGEPHFDIPDEIKEEGIKWIRAGFNKYTPSGGIPELRKRYFITLKPNRSSATT